MANYIDVELTDVGDTSDWIWGGAAYQESIGRDYYRVLWSGPFGGLVVVEAKSKPSKDAEEMIVPIGTLQHVENVQASDVYIKAGEWFRLKAGTGFVGPQNFRIETGRRA